MSFEYNKFQWSFPIDATNVKKLLKLVALSREQKNHCSIAGRSCCIEQPAHYSVVAFCCIQQSTCEKPIREGGRGGGGRLKLHHSRHHLSSLGNIQPKTAYQCLAYGHM